MYRMKFEFDDNKLSMDPELDEQIVLDWLDSICMETRFYKIGKGEYELKPDADEIGTLLILLSKFDNQSWLIPNLKSWKTFSDEEGEQDALKVMLEEC